MSMIHHLPINLACTSVDGPSAVFHILSASVACGLV